MLEAISPPQIWEEVLTAYTYNHIGRKLLQVVKENSGGSFIIDTVSPHKAVVVPAHGETPIVIPNITKVTVQVYNIKEDVNISEEVIEDSNIGKMKSSFITAIDGVYEKEDSDIIKCFYYGAGTTLPWSYTDINQLPIIKDIISAIRILEDKQLKGTHLLLSPNIAQAMRNRGEFKETMESYNMIAFVNVYVPDDCVIVLDANKAGVLIVRKDKNFVEYKKPRIGMDGGSINMRIAPVITNSNAVVKIMNAASTPDFDNA